MRQNGSVINSIEMKKVKRCSKPIRLWLVIVLFCTSAVVILTRRTGPKTSNHQTGAAGGSNGADEIFNLANRFENLTASSVWRQVPGAAMQARSATEHRIGKISILQKYDMRDEKSCNDSCQGEIQKYRKGSVSRACKLKNSSEKTVREVDSAFVKSLDHIYVLDEYKLLFCYVPKVACTNWKRILLMLMGELPKTSSVSHSQIHNLAYQKIPTLKKYTVKDAVQRLYNYTKVLFVREPFSRLVSAYRDKLEVSKNPDSKAFRVIYSAKMKGINLKEIGIGYRPEFNVTFYEFISYLSNPINKLELPGEEHWRTIDELCQPCDLQYDFIGRMETLHRDTDYVIRRLLRNYTQKLHLKDPTNFTNSSSSFVLRDYISEIPEKMLKNLTKRFQIDFEAFAYKQPVA